VEALDEGVLHRPARADEEQIDPAAVRPGIEARLANSLPLSQTITLANRQVTVEDAMERILSWRRDPRGDPHAARPEPIASEFNLSQVFSPITSERIDEYRRTNQMQGIASFRHDERTSTYSLTNPAAPPPETMY